LTCFTNPVFAIIVDPDISAVKNGQSGQIDNYKTC